MEEISHVLRLGPGLYVDSNGSLLSTPPPSVAVYEPPFALPIDPAQARDTLKSISDTLKGLKNDKNVKLALHVWGASDDILKVLDGIAQLTSALSVVGTAISVGVQLLKVFGILKDGPNPLELLINQRFDKLEVSVSAIAQIINLQKLGDARTSLDGFSDSINSFRSQMAQLTLDEYLQKQSQLAGALPVQWAELAIPLDPSSWMSPVLDQQHQTWQWLQHVLFTMPTHSRDRAQARPAIKQSPYFDHRLMVPLVSVWVGRYLAGLRTLSPEYRSNGDYRDSLRTAARKVDELAKQMRESCLARTFYGPEHFQFVSSAHVHNTLFGDASLRQGFRTPWPVGALDVRYHDDTLLHPFLRELSTKEFFNKPSSTTFACMDFGFVPPAKLGAEFGGYYQILNSQECADAANAEAEKRYSDMLSMSGYIELLRLAALLRHESTEPLESQTVTPRTPKFWVEYLNSKSVTVKSRPAYGTGEIVEAQAREESRNCAATVRIKTQPKKRGVPAARYKVTLRTLAGQSAYADFFSTSHQADPDNIGFKRLVIDKSAIEVDAKELPLNDEWTASPRGEPLVLEGEINILADTANWWIPVLSKLKVITQEGYSLSDLHNIDDEETSVGSARPGEAPGNGNTPTISTSSLTAGLTESAFVEFFPGLTFSNVTPRNSARVRDEERKTVSLQYLLQWSGEDLKVSVRSKATNRSVLVYLVIEEQLTGSGKVLHTAVPLPLQGLVTFVPQKFFDDEFAAHAQSARAIAKEIARRLPNLDDFYPPHPLELDIPAGLISPASVEHAIERLRLQNPEVYAEVIQGIGSTTKVDHNNSKSH